MLFTDCLHHHHHHNGHRGPRRTGKAGDADTMHMRKPSSSDSVSSLSSSSTATSTSPTRSHHSRHSGTIEFDPLSLNPTFQAPPRLSERPFIHTEHDHSQPREKPARELQLPPVASPSTTNHDRKEQPDYFQLKLDLIRRPTLQRSHWSESTIQTLDMENDEEEEEEEQVVTPAPQFQERLVRPSAAWQNFSYKRNTVPRRPSIKNGDSIENYIKRGGWKRRGIVFQQSQQETENEATDRYSAHTVS